jgi:WD40 repeat protein
MITVPTWTSYPLILDVDTGFIQSVLQAPKKVIHWMEFDPTDRYLLMQSFSDAFLLDGKTGRLLGYLCDQLEQTRPTQESASCPKVKATMFVGGGKRIVSIRGDNSLRILDTDTRKSARNVDQLPVAPGSTIVDVQPASDESNITLLVRDPLPNTKKVAGAKLSLLILESDDEWATFHSRSIALDFTNDDDNYSLYTKPSDYVAFASSLAILVVHNGALNVIRQHGKLYGKLLSSALQKGSLYATYRDGSDELIAWSDKPDSLDLLDNNLALAGHYDTADCHLNHIRVQISKNSIFLFQTSGELCIVDRESRSVVQSWQNPRGQIRELVVSPDESHFAVLSYDDTVALWSMNTLLSRTKFKARTEESEQSWFVDQEENRQGVYRIPLNNHLFLRLQLKTNRQIKLYN